MGEATGNIENQKTKLTCLCKPPMINIYDKYSLPYKKHKIKHILQDKQTNKHADVDTIWKIVHPLHTSDEKKNTRNTNYIYRFNILY